MHASRPVAGDGPRSVRAKPAQAARTRRVAAGSALFRRGEPLQHVFAVAGGVVEVSRSLGERRSKIIGLALAGDVVGCDALATGVYGGDAWVVRDCVVWPIDPRRAVNGSLRGPRLPGLAELAQLQMARMLRQESRLRLCASMRVRDFLLQLAERGGSADIEFPVDCKDVANYLGLCPETMSRVLRDFTERNCLRRLGRVRFQLDLQRLRQSAGSPAAA